LSNEPPTSLAAALDLRLSQILRLDLLVGLIGGGGAIWVCLNDVEALGRLIPIAATVIGIVIGAVLAGIAILASYMDQQFLRKLREIGREPVRYLRPFLFTALLGVSSSLLLLALAVLPNHVDAWVLASVGGLTGTAVWWTIASVIADLDVLVQFIGLQFDASNVPDLPPPDAAEPPAG